MMELKKDSTLDKLLTDDVSLTSQEHENAQQNVVQDERQYKSIEDELAHIRKIAMNPANRLKPAATMLLQMTADDVRDEAELILAKKSHKSKAQRDIIMSLVYSEAVLMNREAEKHSAMLLESTQPEAGTDTDINT